MTKAKKPWKRQTRFRISLIARERGLADAEIASAMNCGTVALLAFAIKHNISLDWLIRGDLNGLLRTVRGTQHGAIGSR
jgi:hypothetical protein